MQINLKSKLGFTLIELLVVIGILAVLAAIAIPSVAGLIDRANVSADSTNANEMTNAVERFTSEYELYCQDLASGRVKTGDLDSAQGRVFNVTGADSREDIELLESTGLNGKQIYRDTKYPANAETMQSLVENYMKTSSTTFTPKQSDCHFYYSPDCGVVVCTETNKSSVTDLNNLIQSKKDAKGNDLDGDTKWIDLTANTSNNNNSTNSKITFNLTGNIYDGPNGYPSNFGITTTFEANENQTWEDWIISSYNTAELQITPNGTIGCNEYGMDYGYYNMTYNGQNVLPTDIIVNGGNYSVECYYFTEHEYQTISFEIRYYDYYDYYMYGRESDKKSETIYYNLDNSNGPLTFESWTKNSISYPNLPNFYNISFSIVNDEVCLLDGQGNIQYSFGHKSTEIENGAIYAIYCSDGQTFSVEKQ